MICKGLFSYVCVTNWSKSEYCDGFLFKKIKETVIPKGLNA